MMKYNYEFEKELKNKFGGTIRWLLVYLYNSVFKKAKPNRNDFIIGPTKDEDYLRYTNTQYKNTLTTIISLFFIFVLFQLILKMLKNIL